MEASTENRLFTLEEASSVLPRVRSLASDLRDKAQELVTLRANLDSFRERKQTGDHAVDGEAQLVVRTLGNANHVAEEMRVLATALEALGCELKDVHTGLLDFRSMREDRVVYLCWRLGEDEIRFWHELDTGFAGRQPL
jgi:hypothetical protein